MKRILVILAVAMLPALAMAQKKKPVKLTELQKVKKEGLDYFKNVYVESNFKDPYSYKLLKCDVYPITFKEHIEELLKSVDDKIKSSDTTRPFSEYQTKKAEYLRNVSRVKNYPDIYKQSDIDRAKKDWDNCISEYNDAIDTKKKGEQMLTALSASEANKIHHYSFYIDCYSNNSYGNPVLGKFAFDYGTTGLVKAPIQYNRND